MVRIVRVYVEAYKQTKNGRARSTGTRGPSKPRPPGGLGGLRRRLPRRTPQNAQDPMNKEMVLLPNRTHTISLASHLPRFFEPPRRPLEQHHATTEAEAEAAVMRAANCAAEGRSEAPRPGSPETIRIEPLEFQQPSSGLLRFRSCCAAGLGLAKFRPVVHGALARNRPWGRSDVATAPS